MAYVLAPTALNDGYRLETFESVGSTNAVALDRAREGDPGRLWLTARHQEAGRGRRGRVWETPLGNLAATLLLVDCCPLQHAATLGFVAGLALSDALSAVAPGTRIGVGPDGGQGREGAGRYELKWPNDVLAHGAKLAGILLESVLLSENRFAVAVGIGVNVEVHPQGLPYPATSLAGLGVACSAETLFLALSDAWLRHERIWDGGRGLAGIRAAWLTRAAGLGSEVAVRIGDAVVRGVFETIDEECRFLVRDRTGRLWPVAAGDVHFGAVASAAAI